MSNLENVLFTGNNGKGRQKGFVYNRDVGDSTLDIRLSLLRGKKQAKLIFRSGAGYLKKSIQRYPENTLKERLKTTLDNLTNFEICQVSNVIPTIILMKAEGVNDGDIN